MKLSHIRNIGLSALFALLTFSSALGATINVKSELPVSDVTARLEAAIEKAGARVFTKVDFQQGVKSVGKDIRPTTVLIFGSPKIGADAFAIGQTIGLYLPLRVLAYEDASGQVWLSYPDPADAAVEHGIPVDHPAIQAMRGALKKLTMAASGNSKGN